MTLRPPPLICPGDDPQVCRGYGDPHGYGDRNSVPTAALTIRSPAAGRVAAKRYCIPPPVVGQWARRPGPVELLKKGKGSPYSITERRVPELIPVLGSQPAGDVSHKPGCLLPLLSARPAVTPAALKRAATNFAAW